MSILDLFRSPDRKLEVKMKKINNVREKYSVLCEQINNDINQFTTTLEDIHNELRESIDRQRKANENLDDYEYDEEEYDDDEDDDEDICECKCCSGNSDCEYDDDCTVTELEFDSMEDAKNYIRAENKKFEDRLKNQAQTETEEVKPSDNTISEESKTDDSKNISDEIKPSKVVKIGSEKPNPKSRQYFKTNQLSDLKKIVSIIRNDMTYGRAIKSLNNCMAKNDGITVFDNGVITHNAERIESVTMNLNMIIVPSGNLCATYLNLMEIYKDCTFIQSYSEGNDDIKCYKYNNGKESYILTMVTNTKRKTVTISFILEDCMTSEQFSSLCTVINKQ